MTIALIVLGALFGAIVGSFLNVVIYRMPLDEPLGLFRKTRSKCPECDAQIAWFDNIPLVSWIVLRGKCRACGWRIPLRYPAVEAVTAALFALCVVRADALELWDPSWVAFAFAAGFCAVLVAASVIDFQHKILPDKLTLRVGPVLCVLAILIVPGFHGPEGSVIFGFDLASSMKPSLAALFVGLAGAVVGAGIIGAIRSLGSLLLKREAMGLGDVKFMGMAGLLLGPWPTLLALIVAMVGGSVLGIAIWLITRNREIPFGPFLALGALAALFYGAEIDHFIFTTYPGWIRGE